MNMLYKRESKSVQKEGNNMTVVKKAASADSMSSCNFTCGIYSSNGSVDLG